MPFNLMKFGNKRKCPQLGRGPAGATGQDAAGQAAPVGEDAPAEATPAGEDAPAAQAGACQPATKSNQEKASS